MGNQNKWVHAFEKWQKGEWMNENAGRSFKRVWTNKLNKLMIEWINKWMYEWLSAREYVAKVPSANMAWINLGREIHVLSCQSKRSKKQPQIENTKDEHQRGDTKCPYVFQIMPQFSSFVQGGMNHTRLARNSSPELGTPAHSDRCAAKMGSDARIDCLPEKNSRYLVTQMMS